MGNLRAKNDIFVVFEYWNGGTTNFQEQTPPLPNIETTFQRIVAGNGGFFHKSS